MQDRPQDDNSFLRLVKGGLRTVTGLVGKRGSQDAYKIGTNTATIGIRGSSGDTVDNTSNCEGVATGCEKLERGVYHQTYTGSYIMQNEFGTQLIGEGQFGISRDLQSPIEVRTGEIPGIGLRDLPFVLGVGGSGRLGPGGECAVR